MASPFPGMDPYLEDPAFWSDFHDTFIGCWREALLAGLPTSYSVRIGEWFYLVERPPEWRRAVYADVSVTRPEAFTEAPGNPQAAVATLDPVTIPLVISEEVRATHIEIRRRQDRALVTVLELLSPANKEEPGRGEYLGKRNGLLRQHVHLVELDLLLDGQRLPLQHTLPPADYYYLLARADRRPDCHVYSLSMRDRLPTLPVPLRAPDADLQIDLAAVFTIAYQRGRYDRDIDYRAEPAVPLTQDQREWVAAHVHGPRNGPAATP